MSDVNTWTVSVLGETVGRVNTCLRGVESTKIVNKTLGGTITVQTIDTPCKKIDVTFLSSYEERLLFVEKESSGALVRVRYEEYVYEGYFEDELSWTAVIPGEWYIATGKMILVEERRNARLDP